MTHSTRLQAKSELLERWNDAAARPKRDVRAALQAERPRVVVITGVGSVAVDDIRSQVREAEGELDLQVVRVSMSRPAEVTPALLRSWGLSSRGKLGFTPPLPLAEVGHALIAAAGVFLMAGAAYRP